MIVLEDHVACLPDGDLLALLIDINEQYQEAYGRPKIELLEMNDIIRREILQRMSHRPLTA